MEIVGKIMRIEKEQAYITRYEVIQAFFRTEEEENSSMASELNKMINAFCEMERKTRHNVVSLPFDIETHRHVIEYINKISMG